MNISQSSLIPCAMFLISSHSNDVNGCVLPATFNNKRKYNTIQTSKHQCHGGTDAYQEGDCSSIQDRRPRNRNRRSASSSFVHGYRSSQVIGAVAGCGGICPRLPMQQSHK